MLNIINFHFFVTALFILVFAAASQDVSIALGPDKIGENQVWTITATIQNEALKNHSEFPRLEGFRKGGTSTQSQTNIVNGKMSSSQSVTMRYIPTKQGTFTLPSFEMKINNKVISSPGKTIYVGAPLQQQRYDPFQNFFNYDPGYSSSGTTKTEFVDVKDDALLAITTSKNEVYVGEGFTTTLSFLVSTRNRASMQFYNLSSQLSSVLKKIKPSECWEENFEIENIEGTRIKIRDKDYTQYKIYQAAFYPLNTNPVKLPSVGLKMIKYKVAKNPSFFGQNRKEDYKTFYSKEKIVTVKELPFHPLRNSVSVGDYRLNERLTTTNAKTGQSITYNFTVYGEGNISTIEKPVLEETSDFDFYSPNIKQTIKKENGRVTGSKSFSYYLIPKEPGTYPLDKYFNWIFFNPKTNRYDTLHPQKVLYVTGESQKNQSIASSHTGSFYDQIIYADNTLFSTHLASWKRIGLNSFMLIVIGGIIFLMIKKD